MKTAAAARTLLSTALAVNVLFGALGAALWGIAGADPADAQEWPFRESTINSAMTGVEEAVTEAQAESDRVAAGGTYWGNDFTPDGGLFDPATGEYEEHPWYGGRDAVESAEEWLFDSMMAIGLNADGSWGEAMENFIRFVRCLDPQAIPPFKCLEFCAPQVIRPEGNVFSCPIKDNSGWTFVYWWPENEIEINDFGISAITPVYFGRPDLVHEMVADVLLSAAPIDLETAVEQHIDFRSGESINVPDVLGPAYDAGLRDHPHLGRTHWTGQDRRDQTYQQEAHTIRTYTAKGTAEERCPDCGELDFRWFKKKYVCIPNFFWYNGYKKGNRECFYTTVKPDGPVVRSYTEEIDKNYIWRFPELSAPLATECYGTDNFHGEHNAFTASAPIQAPPYDLEGMLAEGGTWVGWPLNQMVGFFGQWRACASYRAERWEDRYGDLENIGIIPWAWKGGELICYKGGGQLFPLVGSLMGHQHPTTSAAYLARRSLHISGRVGLRQTSEFSDIIDKLQVIHPEVSECFQVNDIDPYDHELFPPDLLQPEHHGSIRFIHWNMRYACTCQYRGTYPWPAVDVLGLLGPLPFGWGCHNYKGLLGLISEKESIGDLECQEEPEGAIQLPAPAGFFAPYFEAAAQLYPWLPVPNPGTLTDEEDEEPDTDELPGGGEEEEDTGGGP